MQVEQFKNEPAMADKEVRADENTVCEVCGKFGAYRFGDQFLCMDCYQAAGSCCTAEFGKEDGE